MRKFQVRNSRHPLLIKFSGGLTAQLLALMNAIYLSAKFNRPFTMRYFPFSTGTFWPLGIGELLNEGELDEVRNTRGVSFDQESTPGSYIPNFPLRRKGLSYERFLQMFHKLGLDVILRRFRREYVIGAQIRRLREVPKNAASVSGNFPPLLDALVLKELSKRVDNAKLPNPFKARGASHDVVIHYRLGDMRKMPSRNPQFGGHGIVDPDTFKEAVGMFSLDLGVIEVDLVSDEPEIAKRLLESSGFKKVRDLSTSNVWEDLATISSAKVFLGSQIQFSAFGAILCLNNGDLAVFPSSIYGEGDNSDNLGINGLLYFDYKYLKPNHWIFTE